MEDTSRHSARPERRHDLDALRVLATLLLIVFHTARAFDHEPWHVKNDVLMQGMDILVTFVSNWHMPLFFLLAGSGIFYSLRRRSGALFIEERVQRLLIPLTAGMLLLIPPQVYIERIGLSPARQSPINFDGSFFEFYPTFFTHGIYPEGNLSWHHLWFIMYLFLLSTILMPLFLYLRGEGRQHVASWIDSLSVGRRVFLLAIPLMVFRVALHGMFPGPQDLINDVANLITSATLLLYGYLLVADPRMREAVDRNRGAALLVALLGTAGLGILLGSFGWPDPYTGMYVAIHAVWALAMWAWLLTLLGFGQRWFNADRAWIRMGSEIAYPFYIVHQTVIVILAHFILPLNLSVLGKFALIAITSLVLSSLLSFLIKWSNVTRFLFGVKERGDRKSEYAAGSGVSRM